MQNWLVTKVALIMKNDFDGILRRIYLSIEKFFIKSPYRYLSKCTEALKAVTDAFYFFEQHFLKQQVGSFNLQIRCQFFCFYNAQLMKSMKLKCDIRSICSEATKVTC